MLAAIKNVELSGSLFFFFFPLHDAEEMGMLWAKMFIFILYDVGLLTLASSQTSFDSLPAYGAFFWSA